MLSGANNIIPHAVGDCVKEALNNTMDYFGWFVNEIDGITLIDFFGIGDVDDVICSRGRFRGWATAKVF